MAGKDIIIMTQEELKKLHIIRKAIDGSIKQIEAAKMLSLSDRQIRRLTVRVRQEGDSGIAHKSRGKQSNRRLPEEIRKKIVRLYRQKYNDFGPTLLSEKLFKEEDIKISDETIRLWLIETGDIKKRRKHKKHRQWRERKKYFGEMLQMDGSHHNWLEGRGPEMVLMGCIDDATNKIFGRFYEYEGTMPAMDCFKRYVGLYGLTGSVYIDRHTTYKSNAKPTIEDDLLGRKPMSQFERAMEELGVKVIHANSPQAKGRIERLFRTLQDRLVKEMRLKGIKTTLEANLFLEGYLKRHNERFSIDAALKEDLHRPLPKDFALDEVLCVKTRRALRNDFTVAHNKKLYQILEPANTKEVIVEERLNGKMHITHNNRALGYKEIYSIPLKEKPKKPFKMRKKYIPPKDHPWRKYPVLPKPDISILVKTGHF
jgi:hypothetical protein